MASASNLDSPLKFWSVLSMLFVPSRCRSCDSGLMWLQSIAISGCQGAQDEIWDVLDASHQAAANQTEGMTEGMPGHSDTLIDGAEPMMGAEGQSETALVPCHRLQTLACVGCKELTICRLGMHEAPCGDARAASSSSVWLPCPTKAAGEDPCVATHAPRQFC